MNLIQHRQFQRGDSKLETVEVQERHSTHFLYATELTVNPHNTTQVNSQHSCKVCSPHKFSDLDNNK